MTLPSGPILSPNFRLVGENRSELIAVEGVTSINLQKGKGKPWFELNIAIPYRTSMVTYGTKDHIFCEQREFAKERGKRKLLLICQLLL